MKKTSPQILRVIHMFCDRNRFLRSLRTLVLIGVLFCMACSAKDVSIISEEEIAKIQSGNAILIDVRTEEEFRLGSIAVAEHVPHTEILSGKVPASWQKNQSLYLFCRSGRRSGLATDALKTQGFLSVHNVGAYHELKKRFEE